MKDKFVIDDRQFTKEEFDNLPNFVQNEYWDKITADLSDFVILRELRKRLEKDPNKHLQYICEMLEAWIVKREWETDEESVRQHVENNFEVEEGMDLNYGDPNGEYFATIKWKTEKFYEHIPRSIIGSAIDDLAKEKPVKFREELVEILDELVEKILEYEKIKK